MLQIYAIVISLSGSVFAAHKAGHTDIGRGGKSFDDRYSVGPDIDIGNLPGGAPGFLPFCDQFGRDYRCIGGGYVDSRNAF